MFENIVLGFLLDKTMTGYEIKKNMENSTSFFYNTSFGNIYPTLKKLDEAGHITCSEEIINGKLNKHYTITATGKTKFMKWLNTDSEIGILREEALIRVFFFGNLDSSRRKEEIETYVSKLDSQIEILKKLRARCHKDKWKTATLEIGIDYYSQLKKSYQKILVDL